MKKSIRKYEYTVNEIPPFQHLIILSIQHVLLMVMSLGIPILFANQVSDDYQFAASLISFSMITAGLGSIIQSVGLPFIGSKYLCPNVCGPSYFSLSLSAAWTGGFPLMRGMIIFAGLVEMALAPIVNKLRNIFPGYIIGLVVAMVGVSIIKSSVASFFGLDFDGDAIVNLNIIVGIFSLLLMVLSNLWGKGFVKMYCLLIGMVFGWIFAIIVMPEQLQNYHIIEKSAMFALPKFGPQFRGITFNTSMMIPFIVIAISGSLKSFGNLLVAQKISEPNLKETDFIPIKKGLLADGFSTALAGILGGVAVDTSSSNIGLAGSTKVVSRWISVTAGIIFIIFAFFPKLVTFLSLMPKPVLGATIIFAGCFMISTGLKEMFHDGWDPRKTFVMGISLIFGLSTAFLPGLFARTPQFINMFFTDPLPTTTILAVFINQIVNLDLTLKRIVERIKNRK